MNKICPNFYIIWNVCLVCLSNVTYFFFRFDFINNNIMCAKQQNNNLPNIGILTLLRSCPTITSMPSGIWGKFVSSLVDLLSWKFYNYLNYWIHFFIKKTKHNLHYKFTSLQKVTLSIDNFVTLLRKVLCNKIFYNKMSCVFIFLILDQADTNKRNKFSFDVFRIWIRF